MSKRDAQKSETKTKVTNREPPAGGVAKPGASGSALDTVRELARIAGEFGLSEIEVDPSGRIRVARAVDGAAAPASSGRVTAPPIALSPVPSVEPEQAEDGVFISSPFVGTFYRAASPEAAPFADLGQRVKKGQIVCIVEAMKLMNEIESEVDGVLAQVLVKNAEHVEYGQKLFRITKG